MAERQDDTDVKEALAELGRGHQRFWDELFKREWDRVARSRTSGDSKAVKVIDYLSGYVVDLLQVLVDERRDVQNVIPNIEKRGSSFFPEATAKTELALDGLALAKASFPGLVLETGRISLKDVLCRLQMSPHEAASLPVEFVVEAFETVVKAHDGDSEDLNMVLDGLEQARAAFATDIFLVRRILLDEVLVNLEALLEVDGVDASGSEALDASAQVLIEAISHAALDRALLAKATPQTGHVVQATVIRSLVGRFLSRYDQPLLGTTARISSAILGEEILVEQVRNHLPSRRRTKLSIQNLL
jgi:hypothetical protein